MSRKKGCNRQQNSLLQQNFKALTRLAIQANSLDGKPMAHCDTKNDNVTIDKNNHISSLDLLQM